jgi:hypothetical protein
MKTNKKLIEELIEYFNSQDTKVINRALANMMIDMHRIQNSEHLPENELCSLMLRMKHNNEQLEIFSKNGPISDFHLYNIESS